MNWFTRMCRNVGLMVHNIRNPDEKDQDSRKVVRKDTEQEKRGNMVLRRTTIEEVEFRPDDEQEQRP